MSDDLPAPEEVQALADEFDEQMAVQMAILSELTQIRRTLQTEDTGSDDGTDEIVCRSCQEDFETAEKAMRHARDAHGAPAGDEGDLLIAQ